MSRSGFEEYDGDDQWAMIRAAGAFKSAVRGKRGQVFLKDLLAVLDAMPEKRLIRGEFVAATGETCALGVLGKARGIDMSTWDPEDFETPEVAAKCFNVSQQLARNVIWENDDSYGSTPEQRWQYMREWVSGLIKETPS